MVTRRKSRYFFVICCFLHVKNGGVLTNSRFWIPVGLTWVGGRGTENKKAGRTFSLLCHSNIRCLLVPNIDIAFFIAQCIAGAHAVLVDTEAAGCHHAFLFHAHNLKGRFLICFLHEPVFILKVIHHFITC